MDHMGLVVVLSIPFISIVELIDKKTDLRRDFVDISSLSKKDVVNSIDIAPPKDY